MCMTIRRKPFCRFDFWSHMNFDRFDFPSSMTFDKKKIVRYNSFIFRREKKPNYTKSYVNYILLFTLYLYVMYVA